MNVLQLLPDTDFDINLFNQDIDNKNYTFQFSFNYKLNLWVVTIFDAEKNAIASAPLLNEFPIFRLYSRDRGIFSGDVILLDDLKSKIQGSRDSINVTHTLTYASEN